MLMPLDVLKIRGVGRAVGPEVQRGAAGLDRMVIAEVRDEAGQRLHWVDGDALDEGPAHRPPAPGNNL